MFLPSNGGIPNHPKEEIRNEFRISRFVPKICCLPGGCVLNDQGSILVIVPGHVESQGIKWRIKSWILQSYRCTIPWQTYICTMRVSSTLFFLASLAVSGFATVAQIKADIATITTQLHTLDTSITNFPTTGGTLAQALVRRTILKHWGFTKLMRVLCKAIHTNSVTLGKSIDQGTTDVKVRYSTYSMNPL